MQRIGEIVRPVFRSLVFSLGVHSISALRHWAWSASSLKGRYQNEQVLNDRLAYNAAEESARASKVGLWADPDPVAPWEWRSARRK